MILAGLRRIFWLFVINLQTCSYNQAKDIDALHDLDERVLGDFLSVDISSINFNMQGAIGEDLHVWLSILFICGLILWYATGNRRVVKVVPYEERF